MDELQQVDFHENYVRVSISIKRAALYIPTNLLIAICLTFERGTEVELLAGGKPQPLVHNLLVNLFVNAVDSLEGY